MRMFVEEFPVTDINCFFDDRAGLNRFVLFRAREHLGHRLDQVAAGGNALARAIENCRFGQVEECLRNVQHGRRAIFGHAQCETTTRPDCSFYD